MSPLTSFTSAASWPATRFASRFASVCVAIVCAVLAFFFLFLLGFLHRLLLLLELLLCSTQLLVHSDRASDCVDVLLTSTTGNLFLVFFSEGFLGFRGKVMCNRRRTESFDTLRLESLSVRRSAFQELLDFGCIQCTGRLCSSLGGDAKCLVHELLVALLGERDLLLQRKFLVIFAHL